MLSNDGSRYGYYLDNGKIYSNNNGTNLSFLNLKDEIALATPYVFAIIANLLYYILSKMYLTLN